jgi:hypothetical protein
MGTLEIRAARIIFLIFLLVGLLTGAGFSAPAYKVWYSANDGGPNWRILTATLGEDNKDGERRLAIDIGTVGSLDSAHVFSQAVLREKNGFTMWYGGYDGENWRILRATSSDAMNWEKQGIALKLGDTGEFDSMHMTYPFVLKDENIYRMWYTAFDGKTHWRIGYADSQDGIIFKNRKVVLDTSGAGSLDCEHVHTPVVLKHGGLYNMYYAGYGGFPRAWRILRATSLDGIKWTKQGMVLDLGEAGDYDSTNLLVGSALYSEGMFKLWYWAQGSNWRILYATSKNGIDWEKKGLALDLGQGRALDSRGLVVPAVIEELAKQKE